MSRHPLGARRKASNLLPIPLAIVMLLLVAAVLFGVYQHMKLERTELQLSLTTLEFYLADKQVADTAVRQMQSEDCPPPYPSPARMPGILATLGLTGDAYTARRLANCKEAAFRKGLTPAEYLLSTHAIISLLERKCPGDLDQLARVRADVMDYFSMTTEKYTAYRTGICTSAVPALPPLPLPILPWRASPLRGV